MSSKNERLAEAKEKRSVMREIEEIVYLCKGCGFRTEVEIDLALAKDLEFSRGMADEIFGQKCSECGSTNILKNVKEYANA